MVAAYKRADGSIAYKIRTDKDGVIWGAVKSPKGNMSNEIPLISIVAHGYWEEYKENN